MIRAPGLVADLDVPFMPRFSLYCYSGDGGADGGGPGGQLGFEEGMEDQESYDPGSFSGIGQEAGSYMDPHGLEGMSGFTSSGAPGMGQADAPSPEGGAMGLFDAVSKGYKAAYAKDPGLMTATAIPGLGILGLAAALDNAPPGSLAAPEGSNVSGPGGGSTGADGDAGDSGSGPDGGVEPPPPPPKEPPPAPPPPKEPPPAPTIIPRAAVAAPGTLISRRRRSRTILTTPQGVAGLGGDGSAVSGTRRTRSLPRKTLLGG